MSEYKRDSITLAKVIRIHALRMTHKAHASHIGSCLSMADILAVLYADILQKNDRFILSKGHGAAAIYAVLAECGYFPKKWLDTYCQDDSILGGHITYGVPGVEVSTGSLGHGLSIGCGMALMGRRVFVLLSDGDCDESSTWEAALFAAHHHLDNLVAIVDYNKLQAFGTTKEVLDLEPLASKWRAFGWGVQEVDGHNHHQIENALIDLPSKVNQPSCIIAHTIKGNGVSWMENSLVWHYKSPNDEELKQALTEL